MICSPAIGRPLGARVFCMYSVPLQRVDTLSDEWRCDSYAPFTWPSPCCFSSSSTTCFNKEPLSTPPPCHPLTPARWTPIIAVTLHTAGQSGILCGVVSLPSSRAHGLPSIPIFHVRRSGIRSYHSPSIVCHCLFVRYWSPSMC